MKKLLLLALLALPLVSKAQLVQSAEYPQFREGMTLENHGPVWHIDHIRPCASFDLTDKAQAAACFHYSNLQPLFAEENLAKSDSFNL